MKKVLLFKIATSEWLPLNCSSLKGYKVFSSHRDRLSSCYYCVLLYTIKYIQEINEYLLKRKR